MNTHSDPLPSPLEERLARLRARQEPLTGIDRRAWEIADSRVLRRLKTSACDVAHFVDQREQILGQEHRPGVTWQRRRFQRLYNAGVEVRESLRDFFTSVLGQIRSYRY